MEELSDLNNFEWILPQVDLSVDLASFLFQWILPLVETKALRGRNISYVSAPKNNEVNTITNQNSCFLSQTKGGALN